MIQKYLLYNLNRYRIDRIINNQFILFFKFIVKDVSLSFIHDKQILFNNIITIKKLYRLIIDFFKDSLRITFKKIKISRLSIKSYIE